MYFLNTNLPEERVKILLPGKEICKLPGDGQNVFKRSNINRYIERPSATLCNGKYSVLNNFSYAEFLPYHPLGNKSNKGCEYQSDELGDNVIEK